MERVIFRHLSGSRFMQVDAFPLDGLSILLVGRDPDCAIHYDPIRDDLVGRQHARIVKDPADPYVFMLVDLASRNGTFVNGRRITRPRMLMPGDIIQFGAMGPEVEFGIDPMPPRFAGRTRAR